MLRIEGEDDIQSEMNGKEKVSNGVVHEGQNSVPLTFIW